MYKNFCYSCGIPLEMPGVAGKAPNHCIYCTDGEGHLKSWEEVVAGTAAYLASWQPNVTPDTARERAIRYLTAMPAWADKAEGASLSSA